MFRALTKGESAAVTLPYFVVVTPGAELGTFEVAVVINFSLVARRAGRGAPAPGCLRGEAGNVSYCRKMRLSL